HRDRYTYQRALSTSVWSATFGRHLGLDRVGIRQLALGGLLLDVGKTRLPPALLENPNRLSSHEIAQLKQHVELGLEIIDERADVPNEVRNMVHSHHERYNGEGYPQGLQGAQIPLFGRLAGVVDTYDRLTTPRPYTECRSPHDAINMLYDCRDVEFQGELVEQFIQAVGIFPTGTLVELSTGEVGVIISLNGARRLRPRIMLILDKDKRPYRRFTELDLMEQEQDSDGNLLNVKKGLAPGAYGIDPDNLFL
ncbi:MAG: HD domain-containing phosphohydrolase, partial [Pseudomonadota bacterium]